ncbi:MAG: hypothetical protein M3Y91_06710 [Actinomycetota bacterium]|nr:hypothetical protein [Actinomycetota bacterium]
MSRSITTFGGPPIEQKGLTVYLAGRYTRREELCAYKAELEARGHDVPARWLLGEHQVHGVENARSVEADGPIPSDQARLFAQDDIDDLSAADLLVAFTEKPRTENSRGGRHVELGIAIGKRLAGHGPTVVIVGPLENVFCAAPQIDGAYRSWPEFLAVFDALPDLHGWGCNEHPLHAWTNWHRAAYPHASALLLRAAASSIVRSCPHYPTTGPAREANRIGEDHKPTWMLPSVQFGHRIRHRHCAACDSRYPCVPDPDQELFEPTDRINLDAIEARVDLLRPSKADKSLAASVFTTTCETFADDIESLLAYARAADAERETAKAVCRRLADGWKESKGRWEHWIPYGSTRELVRTAPMTDAEAEYLLAIREDRA